MEDDIFKRMLEDLKDISVSEGTDLWNRMNSEDKDIAMAALKHLARLKIKALTGVDVSGDMLHVTAQLANMQAVTALEVRQTFVAIFERSVGVLTKMFRGLVG